MDGFVNILDETILKDNIVFASLFIMNYECLKDFLVSQMRDFLTDEYQFRNGEIVTTESQKYKMEIKRLDPKNKNRLEAALQWFKEFNAIDQDDIRDFYEVRERRNDIVHELAESLWQGFSEYDIQLLDKAISLYHKVDKWWINEIEIPIAGGNIPEEFGSEDVIGSQAIVLSLINDVALGKGEAYTELLDMIKKKTQTQ